MYDNQLAYRYLEIIQSVNHVDLNTGKLNVPENYRKIDKGMYDNIQKSYDMLKSFLPKYETFETSMVLAIFKTMAKKDAQIIFGKEVEVPICGSAYTMELNASFCVPESNINASFLLFDIGLQFIYNCISNIVTSYLTSFDFPDISNNKQKIKTTIFENERLNIQFIKAICACFSPLVFPDSQPFSNRSEIQIHGQLTSYSCYFAFAHEYAHFHLSHLSMRERTLLMSSLNIDIHKREHEDEFAADYYSLLMLRERVKMSGDVKMSSVLATLGIVQIFVFLHIVEGYKKLLNTSRSFETHPPASDRFDNLKDIMKRDNLVPNVDDLFEIVGFIFFGLNQINEKSIIQILKGTS